MLRIIFCHIEFFVLHIITCVLKYILKFYIAICFIINSMISSVFISSLFCSNSHSFLGVVEANCLWFLIFKFKNYKCIMEPTSVKSFCGKTSNFLKKVIYSSIFSQWWLIVYHFGSNWGRFLKFATNWPKNKEFLYNEISIIILMSHDRLIELLTLITVRYWWILTLRINTALTFSESI